MTDLRFALRTLRRSPGFLSATVVTIALGIGATTALVTAVDRIVFRPLPFPDSERTIVLCETSPRTADFCVASPANVADWARAVPAFEAAGVARSESAAIERDGRTISVPAAIASPGFFAALAIRPAQGRLLEEGDLDRSRNGVVMISNRFWREHLAARPAVLGEFLTINGRPMRIVGVLPADVYVPSFDSAQVWKPLTASVDNTSNRNWRGFLALGRLAPGRTMAEANSQLEVVRARLAAAFPDSNTGWGLRTETLREHVVGSTSSTLWLFLIAASLVLIIACVNVAGLLLVRASTRAQEFSVRAALGASPWRLVRQLMTESVVLAVVGGALGLWLGATFTRVLVRLAPDSIPRLNEVQVDGRVALFALGLTLVTSVFFGLVPARALSARTTAERLKSGRLVGGNRDRGRSALVVAELTLSIVLLLAAAVLTRSFIRLLAWDPGFDRSGVSVAWTLVPPAPGRNTQSAVALLERLREETAAVPGVVSAGLASGGPLFGGAETGVIDVAGAPPVPPDQAPTVNWYDVDPNYFRTLDRRVVAGRGFTAADVNGAPPTAMVNETLAARLFSGRSPLGQRVTVQGHAADIVGLVADVRPLRPDRGVPAEIFWPIRQFPRYGAYLIVRTAPGAPGVERAVNDRAAAIDPAIRLAAWTPLERQFDTALVSPRFNMLLLGVFALVAIGLAAIGLYGVIACSVATRTREIGVRMALGATSRDVVRGVVAGSARLALLAAGLGVTTTFALGRILSSVAYGVTVADPLVLAATLGGFAIVTLIAGYIPARRASRIDPLAALRSE